MGYAFKIKDGDKIIGSEETLEEACFFSSRYMSWHQDSRGLTIVMEVPIAELSQLEDPTKLGVCKSRSLAAAISELRACDMSDIDGIYNHSSTSSGNLFYC